MVGAGTGTGPPSARSRRFLDAEGARPARLALGVLAIVLALDGFVIWALSFVPGYPAARTWPAFVMPAFVLMFLPFGAMVLNETVNRPPGSGRRTTFPAALRGWRGVVGGLAFGAVWVSGALLFASGSLSGQPMEVSGRYTSNNHGVITELTEEEYLAQSAAASRLFAGGVFAFATIAALVLTATPVGDRTDEERAAARLSVPRQHPSVPLADLRGHRRVEVEVTGSVDEVVERLSTSIPVVASPAADGSARVVAEWSVGKLSMLMPNEFPVLLDGSLTAEGATTVVDVSIRPATRTAELSPLSALWVVVILILGFVTVGRHGPLPFTLFFLAIAGFALFAAYQSFTAPRRAAAAVDAQIREALPGPGTRPIEPA
jgi:hypothetical protein